MNLLLSLFELQAAGARVVVREDLAVGGRQVYLVNAALTIGLTGVVRFGDTFEVTELKDAQPKWLSMILTDLGIDFKYVV
jgi:hypothetical protein